MAGMAPTRGMGSYSQAGTDGHRQLSSQWSFSRQDLPHISEMGMIPDIGESIVAGGCNSSSDGGAAQSSASYLSRNFSVSSWDDTNSIMFSSPNKKAKLDPADDMVTSFSNIDSQQVSTHTYHILCLLAASRHGSLSSIYADWSRIYTVWVVEVVAGDARHG